MKQLAVASFLLVFSCTITSYGQNDPVVIRADLSKTTGDMRPVWAWFGYDEPNYTYMKDGKKLLSELAALSPVPVYVRAHNLLTTGDGTAALKWGSTNAYTEDAQGNPVYNWRIADSIFDTYVQRGMKPLAQIGFMPEALSVKPDPYRHYWQPGQPYNLIYTGWAYPPNDYKKWGALVYEWVKHCVVRYGKKEVESWYWELWNEPNIGYWKGTVQEFCKLYDYTADAVKRALPTARLGGPDATGPSWDMAAKFLKTFIQHCTSDTNYVTGKIGTPLDFIAFHAKGAPKVVDGHVRMGIGNQLRDISEGFKLVASIAAVKNLPIVIGESDPEGCAACGMATNPENAYRNGTMYSSYTAASFARKYLLADHWGVNFLGAVSWSFEFENQPWFYGFRDLATNGVDKPVLNVFRMFGMMKGKRVEVTGNRMTPLFMIRDSGIRKPATDIGGMAASYKKSATIMIWNYHDDDLAGQPENVQVVMEGVSARKVILTQYVVDKHHSNSYEVWKQMGSPQQPTPGQVSQLEKAGQLEQTSVQRNVAVLDGKLIVPITIERQGVVLLKVEW
ncbi:GH39 family glycosyl hydrolase [Paraflavitalea speifideaquila]|uniref:GH39 family glycosyl hydrolase n=1 Tax=Paraflavitalea speifideaquila TaxID=3076558 RepID=UPI0028E949C8|nr:beta-xylosidase [Paraflavitalea speifideiaquila]